MLTGVLPFNASDPKEWVHCHVARQPPLLEHVEPFTLGASDVPHRLLIPEKLFGRDAERETLLNAFDRVVVSGMPEVVFALGYSGIGKSSVVNELHKAIVPPRGIFLTGKFDQYKRNIPYATLAKAFYAKSCLNTQRMRID